jgi:hypothetical protein
LPALLTEKKHALFSPWCYDFLMPCDWEVRGYCTCKEMPVIQVNKVVDKKRIIGKNGGPRRRRVTRGRSPPPSNINI